MSWESRRRMERGKQESEKPQMPNSASEGDHGERSRMTFNCLKYNHEEDFKYNAGVFTSTLVGVQVQVSHVDNNII